MKRYSSPELPIWLKWCRSCKLGKGWRAFGNNQICKECRQRSKGVKTHRNQRYSRAGLATDGQGLTYADRDATLSKWGFKSYREYLESDRWTAVRLAVFAAKGDLCILCRKPANQVHHTRYQPNDLTGRSIEHLHPFCGKCHKRVEIDGKGRKRSMKKTNEVFRKIMARSSASRIKTPQGQ